MSEEPPGGIEAWRRMMEEERAKRKIAAEEGAEEKTVRTTIVSLIMVTR